MNVAILTEPLEVKLNNFEDRVLFFVSEKGMTYIDAVLEYCNENELEPEYIKNIMTAPIRQKLEREYQALHFLPKNDDEELPFVE